MRFFVNRIAPELHIANRGKHNLPLSIIGSGFGRTGTTSLALALTELGFGPCHEMQALFPRPDLMACWIDFAKGLPVDWEQAFAGFQSQVDWPGADAWRELAAAHPRAKVIHTVRPEEAWWNSFSTTIGKFYRVYGKVQLQLPPNFSVMADTAAEYGRYGAGLGDRDAAIAAYRQREADVRAAIAPERLLVYEVAQGWEPLCKFLGVPVPATPFPRTNALNEFWAHFGGEPA
jgi:hypothetical protein